MGTLDQITQLRNQGLSDQEITKRLQQQGVSPKEISDALSQANIKNAVSSEESKEGLQPSIMEGQQDQKQNPQDYYQGYNQYGQTQTAQAPPTTQEYQDYYSNYQDPYSGQYTQQNSDSMLEIAEQVFAEKIKKFQKDVKEIKELKTITETKLDHLTERVKRIDTIIDKIYTSVLDKVGSYGKDLGSIKKEMSMIEDSFKKMTGKAADNITMKKHSKETHSKKKVSKK